MPAPGLIGLLAGPLRYSHVAHRIAKGGVSGQALARRGDVVGAIDRINLLLPRGRQLRIQRLPEIPVEFGGEGRRLPQLLPFRRELPPPPPSAAGVHQQRGAQEQCCYLPRQPPPYLRGLVHHPLPVLDEVLVLAPGLSTDLRYRARLLLLKRRRGPLHRLGQRCRGPGVEVPTGLGLLLELLSHLHGLISCLPQRLQHGGEVHEIRLVLLGYGHGYPPRSNPRSRSRLGASARTRVTCRPASSCIVTDRPRCWPISRVQGTNTRWLARSRTRPKSSPASSTRSPRRPATRGVVAKVCACPVACSNCCRACSSRAACQACSRCSKAAIRASGSPSRAIRRAMRASSCAARQAGSWASKCSTRAASSGLRRSLCERSWSSRSAGSRAWISRSRACSCAGRSACSRARASRSARACARSLTWPCVRSTSRSTRPNRSR